MIQKRRFCLTAPPPPPSLFLFLSFSLQSITINFTMIAATSFYRVSSFVAGCQASQTKVMTSANRKMATSLGGDYMANFSTVSRAEISARVLKGILLK